MKDPFNRFAVRFLAAVGFGLAALFAHGWSGLLLPGIFLPRSSAPFELAKLLWWPPLLALLIAGVLDGGWRRALRGALAPLTVVPVLTFFLFWAISALQPGVGVHLSVWLAALAVELALMTQERSVRHPALWRALAVILGGAFVLFSLLPPPLAPFLHPDAAVMAVLPC